MNYEFKTNQINIRDPFVLPFEGKYYMYGSRVGIPNGFDVYISEDLENWTSAKPVFEYSEGFWAETDFWAPEVHLYHGRFYMFATFKGSKRSRGTAILVSTKPDGPFVEHSEGALTPDGWECLDGTLHVSEDGTPYMVFCHEWMQIGNGTICVIELSKDLKTAVSKPRLLWHAGDAVWAHNLDWGRHEVNYVTDGPCVLEMGNELIILWSSFNDNGYVEAIARSDNGKMSGNWSIDENLLYDRDGGHGMIFKTFEGQTKFVCHAPNTYYEERPVFKDIRLEDLFKNNEKESE